MDSSIQYLYTQNIRRYGILDFNVQLEAVIDNIHSPACSETTALHSGGSFVYRQLIAGRRGTCAPGAAMRASNPSSGPIRAPATVTTSTEHELFALLPASVPPDSYLHPINLFSSPFFYFYLPLRYPITPLPTHHGAGSSVPPSVRRQLVRMGQKGQRVGRCSVRRRHALGRPDDPS